MNEHRLNQSVRFLRGWQGRAVGTVATPEHLTYGQRDALVLRRFAEWVEHDQSTTSALKKRLHKETAQ